MLIVFLQPNRMLLSRLFGFMLIMIRPIIGTIMHITNFVKYIRSFGNVTLVYWNM